MRTTAVLLLAASLALVMSQVLDDNGWTGENGDPDMGKILEDSTSQP